MLQLSEWVAKVKDSMTDVLANFGVEEEEEEASVEEELEMDDSLGPLEKMSRYLHSDLILHRLYLVRELGEFGRQLGYEQTVEQLLTYLPAIQRDVEPVIRQALVEQLPHMASFLLQSGGPGAVDPVTSKLLPIVSHFSRDINSQVRLSSTEALVGIAKALYESSPQGSSLLEAHVFPIITTLAKDTSQEEYRVEAAQLVHHLGPIMGQKLCVEFGLPLHLKLSQDTFRVRKAVAGRLGNFAQFLPDDALSQQLVPLFVRMADDEIWGVRKACAESLVSLSQAVSPSHRTEKLVPIFEKLAEDTSRWVRSAAFQNLGHFIATFSPQQVTTKLLKYYNNMVAPNSATKYGDSEIVTYCAFDFPAVLYTIGSDRWDEIKETYHTLVKDLQWKVRRPLAHSLHEVARMLGTELAETHLVPVFQMFLKDLDEVKVGVVKNISAFLAVLSQPCREKYLPLVCDITNETSNWRFRKLMAKQLGSLSELYSPATVNKFLVPISLQLCQDAVAGVRKAAYQSVGLLIRLLDQEPKAEEEGTSMSATYVEQVTAFASTFPETSYLDRQMYANICGCVCEQVSPEFFEQTFLAHLLVLSNDKVANVRIVVSHVLAKLASYTYFKERRDVLEALTTLSRDKDRDVRFYANSGLAAAKSEGGPTNGSNPTPTENGATTTTTTAAAATTNTATTTRSSGDGPTVRPS